jgi:predicted AlkP superfamily pyrophosphatase or phosphodiesterase
MLRLFQTTYQFIFLLLLISLCFSVKAVSAPEPLVIMIGIDGLRADTLDRMPAPNIQALADSGVRANMIPAMPSKTFVNFYSLATGLYPEHHGMTSNYPYDKKLGRKFERKTDVSDPAWWGGEPIWITAEKQGLKSATYFWVGSEVSIDGVAPTYWKPYEQNKDYGERVDEVLAWLQLPILQRPKLVTLYFSAVDSAAHDFGVGSAEERAAVARVDQHVGDLIQGLKQLGLYQQANIIVVADHGMANLSDERLINLDELIDLSAFDVSDWNNKQKPLYAPFLSLYGGEKEIDAAHKQLQGFNPHLQVFRRGVFPDNYHLDHPDRGPDLMIMADVGWSIYASINKAQPQTLVATGRSVATHGYDNLDPVMQATFVATGPLFKKQVRAKAFENIEVYGLLACALGIKPAKTDGDIQGMQGMLTQTCEQ